MIPGWPSRSSGLTCETTSGIVGSIRQADELSMTVAPRATAAGASSLRDVGAGREERDVDAVEGLGDGLADLEGPAVDRDGPAGRAPGGEQAQVTDRELPLVEDLDHRPTDDAGGTDDRDGEGLTVHEGTAPPLCRRYGHGRSIAAGLSGHRPAERQRRRTARGSRASRRPSPMKLTDEHSERDRDARRDPQPGRVDEDRRRLRGVDHLAPARDRDLHAQAQERQAGLEDDRARDPERGQDGQRAHDVREQVPEQDPARAHADDPGGHDVFGLAQTQHLAADEAARARASRVGR